MLTTSSPFVRTAIRPLRLYREFCGRSSRTEFWSFAILVFGLLIGTGLCLGMIRQLFGITSLMGTLVHGFALILSAVVLFSTLLPSLAVMVRRLHDVGKSGKYLLLGFVPAIGIFVLTYLLLQPSESNANQYGPPPPTAG